MKKSEFLKLMNYPDEWVKLDMYPDELFAKQVSAYVPGDERGAEHDRNGAFHWWLRTDPTKEQLSKLIQLAALDPDLGLGEDVCGHIRKAKRFDEELAKMERRLFAGRGDSGQPMG
jgi:hypothetical protein